MALPELTDEDRRASLEKAIAARSQRAEYKRRLKAGRVDLADVLDEPVMQRAYVKDLLAALPGIGPAKARKVMTEIGISSHRRVQGLGRHQRAELAVWWYGRAAERRK